MNKITRQIFRSWNIYEETPLIMPTPYKISKFLKASPGAVYKEWKTLFSTGFIKKVILMPSDAIARRTEILFPCTADDTPWKVIDILQEPYFMESMHIYHVYHIKGIPEKINKNRWIGDVRIINSSTKTLGNQIKLILNGIIENDDIITFSNNRDKNSTYDGRDATTSLIPYLAYKDIYKLKLKDIADGVGISTKTVSRKLEKAILNGDLVYFPVLNQAVLAGDNIFICDLFNSEINSGNELLNRFSNMPLVYERYLLFHFNTNSIHILLYYNTIEELETCVNELRTLSSTFIITTNFKMYFNDNVVLDI